jgi:hypothetical protein
VTGATVIRPGGRGQHLTVGVEHTLAFWSKVRRHPSGCLLWSGAVNGDNYGVVRIDGTLQLAHRVSYALTRGPVPEAVLVLHSPTCVSRRCVRPGCLRLGDAVENAADARLAGTLRNGTAKLTPVQVRAARAMVAAGLTHDLVAMANGVSRSTITDLISGRNWRGVTS